MGKVPRLLTPSRDSGLALRIPIALLQQVALLLTAVLLIALQLVHAVPSLPALGILERRSHRSDRCWTYFSSLCLYSAIEPLSTGLGRRELWNFKSPQVLACISEETGQGNNHRSHRQVQELLFLVWNPSSASNNTLVTEHRGTEPGCTGGTGRQENPSGSQTKCMQPE